MASFRVENVAFPTRRPLLQVAFQFLFQTSLITSPSSHTLGEVGGSTVASPAPPPTPACVNMAMSVLTNLHC